MSPLHETVVSRICGELIRPSLGHNRMVDHTSVIERAMQFIGPA
ncbi:MULTISPECIES: hypothetical protein [Xanthomonas]|nr:MULTISPECIES: hypothetical protein [Xanthomonas]MCW3191935.1 hypothetical protein [Xanthomonas citri pv. fuscans]